MRNEQGNLVHPILAYGLQLKERLEKGDAPDLAMEQAVLRGMLMTDSEARRWVDFGGEVGRTPGEDDSGEDSGRRGADRFLGVRYGLVCWLDETFTLDSPWAEQWNERKLEGELYGSNDRAWKFWEQARRAESRPDGDALEAYFLCVMLGFQGELRNQPDKLQTWVAASKSRIAKVRWQEPAAASDLDPPTNVPPLHGREQLQRMVLMGGVLLLLLIPVVAFFVVHRLGQ